MNNNSHPRKKIPYTWVMIGLSALIVCVALGFCSSAKGMYIKAITEALSIPRSTFSITDSCRFITTAIVNLFFGALIARFGAKKLIAAGLCSLIASCLIYSLAENVFVFYLGGMLLGLGLSWTTTTMVGYIANIWFKENKGTVMGAILASNGIGAAIAAQLLSPIIHESALGYRNAYRLSALILLSLLVLVLIFFREKPKGVETVDAAVHKKKKRGRSWVGIEYSAAVRKAYFFAALACIFFTGMVLQGITGIATPHLYDVGLDEAYVATTVSMHALALALFKFLTGWIYDRFGLRFTANLCMITSVVTFLLLVNVTDSTSGRVMAMLYSCFSSLALPLETIMLPLYAGDLFGDKPYTKILGLFVSVNTAGYALGAPISNLCYDITGSYAVALYAGCILMAGVILCMNFVISAANRQKKAIESEQE